MRMISAGSAVWISTVANVRTFQSGTSVLISRRVRKIAKTLLASS